MNCRARRCRRQRQRPRSASCEREPRDEESPRWYKSSYSSNGGNCVEVAANLAIAARIVPVRDSKQATGPVVTVSADAFAEFVAGIQAGTV
ncbi:DUF397 domain-containing protein [Streptomyces sp. SID4913]|nr:DUF397 domain-containing protein [Streptomyces sp. SID4913]